MTTERRLFVGNPGTGKSTLINCLVGKPVCEAGLSYGAGKTKFFQEYECEDSNVIYMDTPGLADTKIREDAAKNITIALRKDGLYKIFFMVRLSNGRVVSEDILTIDEVLRSIKTDVDLQFSVIVNLVKPKQYHDMQKRGAAYNSVVTQICSGEFSTPFIIFVPELKELEEGENRIVELPRDFRKFMKKTAPVIDIPKEVVDTIQMDIDSFLARIQELSAQIEIMRQDNAKMQARLLELQSRHPGFRENLRGALSAAGRNIRNLFRKS